jgi:hypothetical protein
MHASTWTAPRGAVFFATLPLRKASGIGIK